MCTCLALRNTCSPSPPPSAPRPAPQGTPLAVPDLKLLIKLYRTRLHMLAHNARAAKRELKPVLALEPPHPTPLVMRAQLELCRGRAKKATRLLLMCMQDQQQQQQQAGHCAPHGAASHHQQALLLNNLGLVHHQQGKHQLALLYLSQALAATATHTASGAGAGTGPNAAHGRSSSGGSGRGSASNGAAAGAAVPMQGLGTPLPVAAVMYNAGLQHLMLHNHAAALSCFRQAAPLYFNQVGCLAWPRAGATTGRGGGEAGSAHLHGGHAEKPSCLGLCPYVSLLA